MRKKALPLCLAALLLLGSCGRAPAKPAEPEEAAGYTRTFAEHAAGDNGYSLSPSGADSLAAVCRGSGVILKAVHLGCREFNGNLNVHLFSVAEEYTDRVAEPVVHVYEDKETSFISGKTYYLFLTGFLSGFYPHPVYRRYAPAWLIGEESTGITVYGGRALEPEAARDLGRYLREEIIAKGAYDREAPYLVPESAGDACAGAEVILVARVLSLEDTPNGNPYIRYARYAVERLLKGEALYREKTKSKGTFGDLSSAAGADAARSPLTQAPADTEIGDLLVLLFRTDPYTGGLDMYSLQHACLPAESEEGREILGLFPASGVTEG